MDRSFSRASAVDASFVEVLRRSAHEAPERHAFRFLDTNGAVVSDLTYEQLDLRARAVGALLQESGVTGERVVLLYPPGEEYVVGFLGCLYGGAVAVPAYPPRRNRNLPRLLAILRDAEPTAILTTNDLMERLWRWRAEVPELAGVQLLATDEREAEAERAGAWWDPQPDPDALAFLQYTSGSTGTPKGVMVSHGNLVANSALIQESFGTTEADRVVSWLPPYHDMGLIGGILQPLYARFPTTLLAPVAFLQQPALWLEVISRERGTISGAPNFAYDLAARRTSPEQRARLDLSSWGVAFNGAEPVRAETLQRFAESFAPQGFSSRAFYPCYGLAEATLFVSGGRRDTAPLVAAFDAEALGRDEVRAANPGARQGVATLVSSGRGAAGQRLRIVDPKSRRCLPPGRVGEVWVGGASVTGGYWRRPPETSEGFGGTLNGEIFDEAFLRTGDLGFLGGPGGEELFITGRQKDLIIIRGRNHYPQDLERTAERASRVLRPGCGAAFSVDDTGEPGGQERLVIVYEVDRHGEAKTPEGAERVMEAVRRAIAEEHEVTAHEVVLVRVATVPKTSSGKIQRRACRDQYRKGELTVVAREFPDVPIVAKEGSPSTGTGTEPGDRKRRLAAVNELRQAAARCLDRAASDLPADRPLTQLGLDSLAAVELQSTVESLRGKTLPLSSLLGGATLDELAAQITADGPEVEPSAAAQESGGFPLSFWQRALWRLERRNPAAAACNTAMAAWVSDLEPGRLERALQRLVRRHPALRTTFSVREGEPYQRVQTTGEAEFRLESAHEGDDYLLRRRLSTEAHRPFALEQGPLLRLRAVPLERGDHVVLLVVHQSIADLWSISLLVRDLAVLYQRSVPGAKDEAGTLPTVPMRYSSHVQAQRRRWQGERRESAERYWRQRLTVDSRLPEPPALPTDRPRPPVQSFTGGLASRRLEVGALRALMRHSGTPLFNGLLGGYQILLHRYSGLRHIRVGTPSTDRDGAAMAGVVGTFANRVVIAAELGAGDSFETLLGQLGEILPEAAAHACPFPLLVEALGLPADPSRSRLFQARFGFHREPGCRRSGLGSLALGVKGTRVILGEDLELRSFPLRDGRITVDLSLLAAEDEQHPDSVLLALEYSTDLFDHTTAERLLTHLEALLAGAVREPGRGVSELPLLTEEERYQLVVRWNDTTVPYPDGVCLHELFEAQAAAAPEAVALIWRQERWTYHRLDAAATRLARDLRRQGVGPEMPVAVLLQRSPKLVVALLAVLKAGGAYVPLDPAHLPERQRWILQDSAPGVLLTEAEAAAVLTSDVPATTEVWMLNRLGEAPESDVSEPPLTSAPALSDVGPNNLAYLLYHSASRKRSAAVAVEHRAPVALTSWARAAFAPEELGGVLASGSVASDLSVFEIFAPLAAGGTLILVDGPLALIGGEEEIPNLAGVKLLNIEPVHLGELVRQSRIPDSVITVVLGGAPASGLLTDATYQSAQVHRVFHLYGAAEHTVYSTSAVVPKPERRKDREPGIGRPLPNARVYVLDRRGEPVPVGMPGELYLGGVGLARGYRGQPGLTAEHFVPSPFAGAGDPGSRLYRTRDWVRYRPDGDLELLHRGIDSTDD